MTAKETQQTSQETKVKKPYVPVEQEVVECEPDWMVLATSTSL